MDRPHRDTRKPEFDLHKAIMAGYELENDMPIDHSKDLGIGRMVHYVAYGSPGGEHVAGVHRAAIITRLDSYGIGEFMDHPTVSVCILNPTGIYFATEVPFNDTEMPSGSWHWPERDRPETTP